MLIAFQNRRLRSFVTWSICLTMVFPPAVFAEGGLFRLVGAQPETTVTRLAKRIDHMERHLDQCGSIVIKTPDVWGESRLMRHRSDVESQLKARLDRFEFRINAVQATRDAAFLATAVALQEQIASTDVGALTGSVPTGANVNNVNGATIGMIGNPNDLGSTSNPGFVPRTSFQTNTIPVTGGTARALSNSIEPVIELDQLNRYLQHLNELRRLNEGDDNADTPGYALNLIRIPVSILPGRRTQEGVGAEVQITIDPYMSEEILPLAFKDFVIKGIVDRIGFDVFQLAQRDDIGNLEGTVFPPQNSVAKSRGANENGTPVTPAPSSVESPAGSPTDTPVDDAFRSDFYNSLGTSPIHQLRAFSNALKQPNLTVGDAAATAGLIDINQKSLLDNDNKAAATATNDQAIQRRLLGDVNHRDLSIPASHRDNLNGASLLPIALHVYGCLVSSGASPFPESRSDSPVEPSHRLDHGLTMPEVDTLLTRETKAAYEFLSQPSTARLWGTFCTPELARRVREHRQNSATSAAPSDDSLFIMRRDFFAQIKSEIPGAHGSVTEALAWQVIVESALINERLVKDMKETASLKNCPCMSTEWMQFFGPDPGPEARMAFSEYVKCKWPIHVFALDPVTQDQNISDSFSQRREMQMAVAIAASSRLLGGQAMSRFVRRMEYDLETIELNRTAIGFSHGDNTFGWRFFPRIQSPPVPSNLKVLTHDLLIGGQSRDSLARHYKLESGIRECTALVVMPSFVPQVMVDVRTNWFRLAKHVPFYSYMNRKPDYEASMDLSREVMELRELQTNCVRDAHLYRDGEVYRLCKAVKRLEDRLPLQTHNVPVPWENDLGGFEVFQSGTQVLGPEIHGWYGAPGIFVSDEVRKRSLFADVIRLRRLFDEALLEYKALGQPPVPEVEPWIKKRTASEVAKAASVAADAAYSAVAAPYADTTVFLVGKNFSVLNCRVIAGGVDVTETIQVINRNLMQVRIPSTVSTVSTNHTSGEQRSVVVHLATPYGATSRLLIPVAGLSQVADATKALETAKLAADAATKAQSTADAAKKTADESNAAAKKLTEEFPVAVTWGDKAEDFEFEVQGHLEDNGFEKARFCPKKTARKKLTLHQAADATFEEHAEEVNGQLLMFIKMPANDKRKVGPWDIKNGNFNKDDLTSGVLFTRIFEEIGDELPCSFDSPVELVITSYFKFKSDPLHVVKLQNTIRFKLTVIPKPKD